MRCLPRLSQLVLVTVIWGEHECHSVPAPCKEQLAVSWLLCRCKSSVGVGFRVGSHNATITVGAFVDLTCSNSNKLFLTLLTKVPY